MVFGKNLFGGRKIGNNRQINCQQVEILSDLYTQTVIGDEELLGNQAAGEHKAMATPGGQVRNGRTRTCWEKKSEKLPDYFSDTCESWKQCSAWDHCQQVPLRWRLISSKPPGKVSFNVSGSCLYKELMSTILVCKMIEKNCFAYPVQHSMKAEQTQVQSSKPYIFQSAWVLFKGSQLL